MTAEEFRKIRKQLGLTQESLAGLLGYAHANKISELERKTNPKPVPRYLDLVMEALDAGFWPKAWPPKEARYDAAADAEGSGGASRDRGGHAGRHAQGGGNPVHQHRSRP